MLNEFQLINELNVRYNLKNFVESAIIPSVDGIGYDYSMSYVRVGDTYRRTSKELNQCELSGNVIFKSYRDYQQFVNFIESSEELRVIYKPLDVEYYRSVDFAGVTGVKQRGSTTECTLKLSCKGLYYTEDFRRYMIETIENEAKFDLTFPFVFNDNSAVNVAINNIGHSEAEIMAEIYGYVENPEISLYVDGQLKSKVSFNIEVAENEVLFYSARDGEQAVYKVDAQGNKINAVGSLSLENNNFYKIPKGNSSLKLTSNDGILNKVIIKIFTTFKGV